MGVVEKGSTQIVAEMITEETGADLFKLETVNAYPEDYMECVTVTREEKNANARPRLKAVPQNLAEYKKIQDKIAQKHLHIFDICNHTVAQRIGYFNI